MRDLSIIAGLFFVSFILSFFYPYALWGLLILFSLGYILKTALVSSRDLSVSEHLLISVGIGLLAINAVAAALVYSHRAQWFKPVLLALFVAALFFALMRKRRFEIKLDKGEIYPWIAVGVFFLVSIALRHADFRIPDEYLYLYKIEDIIEKGQLNSYASKRYLLVFTYSGIMQFSNLTFRSAEIASLFFVSMSLMPTYLLGKELFDRRVGYIALLFLAFNPSFIFNSIRLLPWALSIFLLTSYLYFFYKWTETRSNFFLLIASMFLFISIFVKLHGLLFLGLGIIYLILAHWKDLNRRYFAASVGILLLFSWFLGIPRLLQWFVLQVFYDMRHDVITAGYKTYVTYFAPDLYGMPFVLLFFLGLSALYKEQSRVKLFLLIPIVAYILLFSDGFGIGVRHFLVVVPLMSIIAAYGLTSERRSRSIFSLLTFIYFAVLAIMVYLAPVFPHLNNVIPDIPVWMRVLTFGSGGLAVLFMIKMGRRGQTAAIILVIFAALLNAHFFVSIQDAYPDDSNEGLKEAGIWLSENTPVDARIQSTTGEIDRWRGINKASNPEALYPKSTFLSYYVNRTTYTVPENDSELLRRIEGKEIDYVVAFSHFMLTDSEPAIPSNYTKKYILEAPAGTELIHTGYNKTGGVQFRVYGVK